MVARMVVQAGISVVLLASLSAASAIPTHAAGAALGSDGHGMERALAQDAPIAAACLPSSLTASDIATPAPEPRLSEGIPDGVAFAPLAMATVDEFPLLPARLTLSRQDFPAGAEIPPTTATGPILFLVERGTLTMYLGGQDAHYGPGSSALVRLGQRYSVLNETAAPATVLRLAVDKLSASDAPVMRIEQLTPAPGTSGVRPTSARLFQATIDRLPGASSLVFIGCARWLATPDGVVHRHPDAVALRMVSGSVQIDDGLPLGVDGCRLFQRSVPFRIQPGDDAALAFLFGVIDEEQRLWLAGDAAATTSSTSGGAVPDVRCS